MPKHKQENTRHHKELVKALDRIIVSIESIKSIDDKEGIEHINHAIREFNKLNDNNKLIQQKYSSDAKKINNSLHNIKQNMRNALDNNKNVLNKEAFHNRCEKLIKAIEELKSKIHN